MRAVRATSRLLTFILALLAVLLLTVAVGSTQLLAPARELVEVAASKLISREIGEPAPEITLPENLAYTNEGARRSPLSSPSKDIRVPPIASTAFEDESDDDGADDEVSATPTTEPDVPTASQAAAPPAAAAPAPTAAPTTAAPNQTNSNSNSNSNSGSDQRPTTTATTTAPAPPQPSGRAGHNGSVGCTNNCRSVGEQNLDGKTNFVLENVIVSNPGGRCLTARNASNITIRNVTFTDCGTQSGVKDGYGTGLVLVRDSSNVTIESSKFENMASRSTIDLRNNALQIENSPNTRIVNNEFRNIHSDISQKANDRGNRAILVRGNNSHDLKIERNSFFNPGRNALQIKEARDLRGVSFSNNRVEGRGPWDSDFEDMVNLYSSSGRANSPIAIRGNYMRNGGGSISGTAIIVGDGNQGAGPSQYIVVDGNVIVNPGHVGINLAGGDHISVTNNIIYGDQNVPHATTVGLIVNHFNYSRECRDHVVTGNRVFMRNQHQGGGVNHVWIPGSCTQNVRIENNSFGDESLNARVWSLG